MKIVDNVSGHLAITDLVKRKKFMYCVTSGMRRELLRKDQHRQMTYNDLVSQAEILEAIETESGSHQTGRSDKRHHKKG